MPSINRDRAVSSFSLLMMICFIFLSVTPYFLAVVDASVTVVVDSPFGKIQGVRKTDEDTGLSHVSFKGIPYAKPPLGDRRFAKPEAHPKIDGVFDATKDDPIMCPVPDTLTYGETMGFTEDCLVLNIQTPDIDQSSNSLKKVLVFIHGGSFNMGTGYFYDAKSFVVSQDVIVVVINYRLGILGFLSTENEASLGNFGLWDQTLALKWVKDNIRSFGGDPHDVTIAGESAGGSSVGYHIITPQSKGLFTKAYPQSGTATTLLGQTIDASSHALTFAKTAGCWEKDVDYELSLQESHAVMKCLRAVPVSVFTSFIPVSLDKIQFVPRMDGDFIPDHPANLLKDDAYLHSIGFFDRSYLVGLDNNEITCMDFFIHMTKAVIVSNSNETSTEKKENMLQKILKTSKELHMTMRIGGRGGVCEKRTVDKINDFYNRRFVDFYSGFIEMMTDLTFLIPSLDLLSAVSRRKSCSAYFLYFDHFPEFMKGARRGTTHGLDLPYWFDIKLADIERLLQLGIEGEMADEDLELKTLFSSIVGEFTRTGNPGVALKNILPSGWPKYDVTTSYYLNFNPNPYVSSFLEKDKQDLWFKTVPNSMKDSRHRHTEL